MDESSASMPVKIGLRVNRIRIADNPVRLRTQHAPTLLEGYKRVRASRLSGQDVRDPISKNRRRASVRAISTCKESKSRWAKLLVFSCSPVFVSYLPTL